MEELGGLRGQGLESKMVRTYYALLCMERPGKKLDPAPCVLRSASCVLSSNASRRCFVTMIPFLHTRFVRRRPYHMLRACTFCPFYTYKAACLLAYRKQHLSCACIASCMCCCSNRAVLSSKCRYCLQLKGECVSRMQCAVRHEKG